MPEGPFCQIRAHLYLEDQQELSNWHKIRPSETSDTRYDNNLPQMDPNFFYEGVGFLV